MRVFAIEGPQSESRARLLGLRPQRTPGVFLTMVCTNSGAPAARLITGETAMRIHRLLGFPAIPRHGMAGVSNRSLTTDQVRRWLSDHLNCCLRHLVERS